MTDISIVGIDPAASRPPPGGNGPGSGIGMMVLNLSPEPPRDWCGIFNTLWERHFFMMKRRAQCTGDRISVQCPPSELESGLLAELQKVVAQTNSEYTAHISRVTKAIAEQNEQKAQGQAEVDAVAQRLNAKLGKK